MPKRWVPKCPGVEMLGAEILGTEMLGAEMSVNPGREGLLGQDTARGSGVMKVPRDLSFWGRTTS